MERVIEIDYEPRPHQWQAHESLRRFNILVWHRRAGKTVFSINQLIQDVTSCTLPDPRGAYVAPLYSQAKRVAWDYMRHFCSPIPGVKFNESELRVDLPGNRKIFLVGADNPDTLRGMYFDSVVMDEVAQMAPRAWTEVIRPALTDRKGKAIFIGTPQGKANSFYRFFEEAEGQEDWYRELLTARDTKVIPPDELAAAEREMSIDEFQQEFHCSWEAAVKGAFYARELGEARNQKRITSVPHNPRYEVFTAWDLGLADATSIWFAQNIRQELHVIRYEEWTNTSLLDIIAEINSYRYLYGSHFAPHDIKVREYSTGASRLDIAMDAGVHFVVTKMIPVTDGIEAGRVMLRRSHIDKERCAHGLAALEQYRMQYNDKTQAFHKQPLHDWTSHAADAWRIMAINFDAIIRPTIGFNKPKVIRSLSGGTRQDHTALLRPQAR